MYALGIDVGSSSVKVAILEISNGRSIASAHYPSEEMTIMAPEPGFAEQDPELWWDSFKKAFAMALKIAGKSAADISCIGISYQMHGLVVVDKAKKVLRPSIIWCDSRAVSLGEQAGKHLGESYCTNNLLNSPGNFTAAKLKWVKENQPAIYGQVDKWMLPGDYIAMKLSDEINSTASGLSEGIFWDFKEKKVADKLLSELGIESEKMPDLVPTFGVQNTVSAEMESTLGLKKGTPISYRAGDQPNNALSLNVLNPGEVAATAGTSGVIYAVTDKNAGDRLSRVNTFLHVNHSDSKPRNGVLLCINGTGILNSWLRKNTGSGIDYETMNREASKIPIGADGLHFLPFGNGAERVLQNKLLGATLSGLDFNRHTTGHLYRAAQEGIVFALNYGFEVLQGLGISGKTIRAGRANMFLSPLFREAFVNTVDARLEFYKTDGAEGAARGAAFGAGYYASLEEAFSHLECIGSFEPDGKLQTSYKDQYQHWKKALENQLSTIN